MHCRFGDRGYRRAGAAIGSIAERLRQMLSSRQLREVKIDNFSFTPATLTVPVGTTVTWTNRDDIPHTVVSADDPKAFKSKADGYG